MILFRYLFCRYCNAFIQIEKKNKTNKQVIRKTKKYCRFQKAVGLKGWSPLSSHCPLQPACSVSARKLFKVPVA